MSHGVVQQTPAASLSAQTYSHDRDCRPLQAMLNRRDRIPGGTSLPPEFRNFRALWMKNKVDRGRCLGEGYWIRADNRAFLKNRRTCPVDQRPRQRQIETLPREPHVLDAIPVQLDRPVCLANRGLGPARALGAGLAGARGSPATPCWPLCSPTTWTTTSSGPTGWTAENAISHHNLARANPKCTLGIDDVALRQVLLNATHKSSA